ncbi:MAG: RNA polymerase sigma factor [Planctomycetes bacterium]|nr:RNA polymerase sigma factor [Planctomycetota bacterium]
MTALTLPSLTAPCEARLTDLRDAEAFRAAALEHRRALWRVATRLLGTEDGAEDVVQEALTRAFAGRDRFRGDARPFTWLCGVLVNVCRGELRRRRVRRWLSLSRVVQPGAAEAAPEPAAPPTPDALERAERREALRAAMARLPGGQRAALVLVAQEGLTAQEAAAALNTTEAAVWQAVSRARRALRDALAGQEGR